MRHLIDSILQENAANFLQMYYKDAIRYFCNEIKVEDTEEARAALECDATDRVLWFFVQHIDVAQYPSEHVTQCKLCLELTAWAWEDDEGPNYLFTCDSCGHEFLNSSLLQRSRPSKP